MGQNLLTDNQASVETDTTGLFANGSSTISRDATVNKHGVASLKTITDNAAGGEGWGSLSRDVSASLAYTASAWVTGSGTVVIQINERNSGDGDIGSTSSAQITLTGTLTRCSVSRTFGATGVKARTRIITDSQQGITFHSDNMQLEQSASATPWRLPSRWSARNAGRDLVVHF